MHQLGSDSYLLPHIRRASSSGTLAPNSASYWQLALSTLTDSPTGQCLISLPKSRAGPFPGSHKEKKLASSAWGSLCWIIVLLQQRDLGLLRKVFRKRMKKNKAWIFRHLENVTKSLKKNNAFWRLNRAQLLLSTLKCDCCHLVFHMVASKFKKERPGKPLSIPTVSAGFQLIKDFFEEPTFRVTVTGVKRFHSSLCSNVMWYRQQC